MKRFPILLAPAFVTIALTGCQSISDTSDTVSASRVSGTDAHGLARQACGECHAIGSSGLSPNPTAPTFYEIANRWGLTLASLTNFLRNAHNYPDEMNFALTNDEEGELASYILTLRDEDYETSTN